MKKIWNWLKTTKIGLLLLTQLACCVLALIIIATTLIIYFASRESLSPIFGGYYIF